MRTNYFYRATFFFFLLLVSRVGMSIGVDDFTQNILPQEKESQSVISDFDNSKEGRLPVDIPFKREGDREEEELEEEKREKNNYLGSFCPYSFTEEFLTAQYYEWSFDSHYVRRVFNDSIRAPFRTQRIFIWCCCFLN